MNSIDKNAWKTVINGILCLAVAIGISRFAYTPMLPAMQKGVGFADDFAGYLATANYLGYLAGSFWAAATADRRGRKRRVLWNFGITLLCTVFMGIISNFFIWYALRFMAGCASAMIFILVSGLVMEDLTRLNRQAWTGWMFAGVGLGICISAVTVPVLVTHFRWQGGWIGLAVICLFIVALARPWLKIAPDTGNASAGNHCDKDPELDKFLPWLVISYTLEGLGYIVTGTFLVTLVERSSESFETAAFVWLLVGLSVIPSCPAWTLIGKRIGFLKALVIALFIQMAGVLLPVIMPGTTGAVIGAICFGGTFVGIAALTILIGRRIDPGKAKRNIAILTGCFSIGQMAGPTIAGILAVQTDGFAVPLYGAAVIIGISALTLIPGFYAKRTSQFETICPDPPITD